MFAPKNARSMTSSGTVTATTRAVLHPQRSRTNAAISSVVITIVPVTAMP